MVVMYKLYVDTGRRLDGISTIFGHTCCDGLHLGDELFADSTNPWDWIVLYGLRPMNRFIL